jgi:hypothetical protein
VQDVGRAIGDPCSSSKVRPPILRSSTFQSGTETWLILTTITLHSPVLAASAAWRGSVGFSRHAERACPSVYPALQHGNFAFRLLVDMCAQVSSRRMPRRHLGRMKKSRRTSIVSPECLCE